MPRRVTDLVELVELEEKVGGWWHRFITRRAETRHPQAAVQLDEISTLLGIWFRALGGDAGLEIAAADATAMDVRRTLLQRLGGTHRRFQLAWRDHNALHLPPVIDHFPDAGLNRDLYLWLAALAAMEGRVPRAPWFEHNQQLSLAALERFPGLWPRYERLVRAHLALRPHPGRLPADERAQEEAIRQALIEPGSGEHLPVARRLPSPVVLWLHPNPPHTPPAPAADADPVASGTRDQSLEEVPRKATERVDQPDSDRGLITVRMENIFTWGEHVRVDRGTEDEEEIGRADEVARDLERISVTRSGKAARSRLKFDLDLPSEAEDDQVVRDGILLPEWHWKQRRLIPDHCRAVELVAADAEPQPLPKRLERTARKLRNQFQALAPARIWYRARPDGSEVDLDAYLRFRTDRAVGRPVAGENLYREMLAGARDLACLLLADLSLSTDTWINDHFRVLDVIRDSLFLFAESLAATGDRFGIYGFSSRKRDPIRIHRIKTFDENYGAGVRGRIQAIRPGYYTRLGAGIRHATRLLEKEAANRRLLLILTDGKPNDLDQYEGRYGIEDTRHAVLSARRLGFHPFCVTIDQQGNDYLPHLFGPGGFVVIRDPLELPAKLPLLYARLTAGDH